MLWNNFNYHVCISCQQYIFTVGYQLNKQSNCHSELVKSFNGRNVMNKSEVQCRKISLKFTNKEEALYVTKLKL